MAWFLLVYVNCKSFKKAPSTSQEMWTFENHTFFLCDQKIVVIFDEFFDPIIDTGMDRDLIISMVHNKGMKY